MITGSADIRFKDNLNWIFISGDIMRLAILMSIIFFGGILILEYIFGHGISKKEFQSAVFTGLCTPIITFSLTVLVVGVIFIKLSQSQREVTWNINDKELMLADSSGNKIIIPWSQIKKLQLKRKGILVCQKPMGSRWIPLRVFSESQINDLMELASKKVVELTPTK